MMRPTRRLQPYRKGHSRPAGPSLDAMKRGRPALRANPQDARRALIKLARRRRKRALRK